MDPDVEEEMVKIQLFPGFNTFSFFLSPWAAYWISLFSHLEKIPSYKAVKDAGKF